MSYVCLCILLMQTTQYASTPTMGLVLVWRTYWGLHQFNYPSRDQLLSKTPWSNRKI